MESDPPPAAPEPGAAPAAPRPRPRWRRGFALQALVLLIGLALVEGVGRVRFLAPAPRLAGKALRVMPFARGGGKEPQQILRLVFLISIGLAPDGVIELDGFNEVALGNKNATVGVHPLFPSAPHWAYYASAGVSDKKGLDMLLDLRTKQQAVDAACDRALFWHVDQSAILGTLALRRVRALKSEFAAGQEACTRYLTDISRDVVSGPAFQGDAKEAVAESVRCWLQTSLT